MQSHRYTHVGAAMPTCPIEHEQNLFAASRAYRLGKLSQGEGERGYGHGREQQPPRAARGRMHKGVEVAPLIAVLNERPGALATGTPHPAQDRFEPKAMLVRCP
jgi:hypothetical protein